MAANIPWGMTPTAAGILRSFYVEYRQSLFTYALSITRQREAAEDAIQQAFHQILRREELPGDLKPYVFRCVRNASLDGMRRAAVRQDSLFTEESLPGSAVGGGDWLGHELDEIIRQLSPDEQEVIVLKIYDGFTFQEIADLRGVPLPTVASWYRRGLEKMQTLLKERS